MEIIDSYERQIHNLRNELRAATHAHHETGSGEHRTGSEDHVGGDAAQRVDTKTAAKVPRLKVA